MKSRNTHRGLRNCKRCYTKGEEYKVESDSLDEKIGRLKDVNAVRGKSSET